MVLINFNIFVKAMQKKDNLKFIEVFEETSGFFSYEGLSGYSYKKQK